jgi:hypothetical protein
VSHKSLHAQLAVHVYVTKVEWTCVVMKLHDQAIAPWYPVWAAHGPLLPAMSLMLTRALCTPFSPSPPPQDSMCLSLEEGDFDSQYVLRDPTELGEERRKRREQQKREEERAKRRALRQLQGQRGNTPVPRGPAPPPPAAVAGAAAAGAPRGTATAAAAAAAAGAPQRRPPPAASMTAADRRYEAAQAAATAAMAAAAEGVGEHAGESDTPAPNSRGRVSSGPQHTSGCGSAQLPAPKQEPSSPGDSSGSRYVWTGHQQRCRQAGSPLRCLLLRPIALNSKVSSHHA